MSYAFCKRFPEELTDEIFEHILNKALNNRVVDPSLVFIDGTHIKASANKKKLQKQQVAKTAKVYSEQLRQEVNAEREKLGKRKLVSVGMAIHLLTESFLVNHICVSSCQLQLIHELPDMDFQLLNYMEEYFLLQRFLHQLHFLLQ